MNRKELDALKKQHVFYLQEQTTNKYRSLALEKKQELDSKFEVWLQSQPPSVIYLGMSEIYRQLFLTQVLLPKDEQNFKTWALSRGYTQQELMDEV